MDIRLEPNQRFVHGLQVRVMDGPECDLYDDEPLTLQEAMASIREAMDGMNEEMGTAYKLTRVTVTPDGVTDIPADRVLAVAERITAPDVREAVVDGERQPVVSGRGVILMAWFGWKDDELPECKDALRRYCEYISLCGYGGGASKAMAQLNAMDRKRGAHWIKRTYVKYVRDDANVVRYVLPQA